MCNFDLAWCGKCEKSAIENTDFCQEHTGLKCRSCGAIATRQCDETMGPMVCGANLCADCEHRIDPSGTSGGGGHVKKGQQEYRPWYWRKFVRDEAGLLVKVFELMRHLHAKITAACAERTRDRRDITLEVYEKTILDEIDFLKRPESSYCNTHDKLNAAIRTLDSFYWTACSCEWSQDSTLSKAIEKTRLFFDEYKASIEYAETPEDMKAYLDGKKNEKQNVSTGT